MHKIFTLLPLLLFHVLCYSQISIVGKLSLLPNTKVRLEGFNGFKTYHVSSCQTDEKGNFKLSYGSADYGVGYLVSDDNSPFFVLLTGEVIEITGETLTNKKSIQIHKGEENKRFEQYAREQPLREQTLSAWYYLDKIYATTMLFQDKTKLRNQITKEVKRIKNEERNFIENLPNSYAKWFLPMRKLVTSTSAIAQYRTEEIPATINSFREIDYTDIRLYKSGLLKDAIESHFWLIENSGKPTDSVFTEMMLSIDIMVATLIRDDKKLNEIAEFLFDLLERHSLFGASEYLAIKILNETSCTLNGGLAKQFETYRAMKKGNIAPDINFSDFPNKNFKSKKTIENKLSDIQSPYTLVVFGASWCPKCTKEVPEINKHYYKWRQTGLEVVFISLDENESDFNRFTDTLHFVSLCDYRKWEGKTVGEYYVFGTPSMYLLNAKRKILLRPSSIEQVDAWVDWFLIKNNSIPQN